MKNAEGYYNLAAYKTAKVDMKHLDRRRHSIFTQEMSEGMKQEVFMATLHIDFETFCRTCGDRTIHRDERLKTILKMPVDPEDGYIYFGHTCQGCRARNIDRIRPNLLGMLPGANMIEVLNEDE